jgi:plastocyanin
MAKAKLNFSDMVEEVAKPKSKSTSKKSDKEIISDAPEAVKKAITAVVKAKAEKKKAESDIKVSETPVIEFGNKLKDERAFNGDYNKSYKIEGSEGETVTFVTANKFSHNVDDEEELAELMGEENFEDLVPKEQVLKVKDDIFTNPEMQEFLMKKMGNRFNEFFEVETSRKVIPTFDEELYKRFDEDKVADIKVFMKQSKPSIK